MTLAILIGSYIAGVAILFVSLDRLFAHRPPKRQTTKDTQKLGEFMRERMKKQS